MEFNNLLKDGVETGPQTKQIQLLPNCLAWLPEQRDSLLGGGWEGMANRTSNSQIISSPHKYKLLVSTRTEF